MHNKSREVCIKTRSPPASLPFRGQVTKPTTVKWSIHATGAMVIFLPPYSLDFMPLKELFTQVKNWIRENDAAWQFCQDPEEAFLHVTDEEVKNYIYHAEYF